MRSLWASRKSVIQLGGSMITKVSSYMQETAIRICRNVYKVHVSLIDVLFRKVWKNKMRYRHCFRSWLRNIQ
jgi:hypothetical protein